MARKAAKQKRPKISEDHDASLTPTGRERGRATSEKSLTREAPTIKEGVIAPKTARNAEFGRRLRAAMLAKGMKQIELSDRTEIGRDSISGYVRGKIYPSPARIKKMADALGTKPESLDVEETGVPLINPLQAREIRLLGDKRAWIIVNREVPTKIAVQIDTLLDEADVIMAAAKGS